jgi:hypothetical protein
MVKDDSFQQQEIRLPVVAPVIRSIVKAEGDVSKTTDAELEFPKSQDKPKERNEQF